MPIHIAWDNHLVVNLAKFIVCVPWQGGAGMVGGGRAQGGSPPIEAVGSYRSDAALSGGEWQPLQARVVVVL